MTYKDIMKQWLSKHPKATVEEAYEAGWFACTEEWCHGKREKMEILCKTIKEILE